jgi:hypothetical protein
MKSSNGMVLHGVHEKTIEELRESRYGWFFNGALTSTGWIQINKNVSRIRKKNFYLKYIIGLLDFESNWEDPNLNQSI